MLCALCLKIDNKGTLFVQTEENRQGKVPSSKVLFSVPDSLSPGAAPEAITEHLKKASQERDQIAAEVPLEELWELLVEDDEAELELSELAELYFSQASAEQLSGLYRALSDDSVWFLRKGNTYRPRPRAQVEEIHQRLETEQRKERELEIVGEWLKQLWKGPDADSPVDYPAEAPEAGAYYLDRIKEVAVHGPEATKFKEINKLLKDLGITRKDAPFALMQKAGHFTADENLLLHKFRTPIEFRPEVETAAREAAGRLDEILAEPRRDLTHLDCFTVDDAYTTEIDDALSLEETGHGYRVGIHIADASAFVDAGGVLDEEASIRGTAIYLPSFKVRMLPEVLGDEAASLVAGPVRPAFSFLLDYDHDFQPIGVEMTPSRVRVRQRLTYDQADQMLAEGCAFSKLYDLAAALRTRRQEQGAVTVPFPRINVRVEGERIQIERDNAHSQSQVMVSEMMILANRTAGEYFAAHDVAGLYRGQQPPEKPIPADTDFTPDVLFRLRRMFRKGESSYKPIRHSGLGLDAYTQVSSPIRRYSDLLMQRQLKACLAGAPFYDEESLVARCVHLGQAVSQADQMERDRKVYWSLRHLEERRFSETPAVVLANLPDRHLVQLTDVLWETECPHIPGKPLPPGSQLSV
ncbi:MAG: RNB domain-containing ribonuclease, partial [Candidatus Eremiobacteraeota bacterium]|nr:RNB domain-containing ribonuclease [Candidatus Eremiobacteraeota bacterium]